ncbi:hypothetical protein ACXJY6_07485 [Vibrio sp. RC27]
MNNSAAMNIEFDYTNFLGESSNHHWTFVELFGFKWPSVGNNPNQELDKTAEQKLWDAAMNRLSSQHSDESNIIVLVELARVLGISCFRLKMPYQIPMEQRTLIEQQANANLIIIAPEEFLVMLL